MESIEPVPERMVPKNAALAHREYRKVEGSIDRINHPHKIHSGPVDKESHKTFIPSVLDTKFPMIL